MQKIKCLFSHANRQILVIQDCKWFAEATRDQAAFVCKTSQMKSQKSLNENAQTADMGHQGNASYQSGSLCELGLVSEPYWERNPASSVEDWSSAVLSSVWQQYTHTFQL